MNDILTTPDAYPVTPPDAPEYCEGRDCDTCTVAYYRCPGTDPVTNVNEDDDEVSIDWKGAAPSADWQRGYLDGVLAVKAGWAL